METNTSVAGLPTVAGHDYKDGGVKWKRYTRDCRFIEFAISVIMYGFALFFAKIQVAQREIPNIEVQLSSTTSIWARDPTINSREKAQQVSMFSLISVGVGAPIITNLFINYVLPKFRRVRIIPYDTRDFFLTLLQSTSMATLLTQFTKNMTGRFRPCFYDMCDWNYDEVWDGVTNLCRNVSGEKEGRKSFPSGHASFAFATMLVLTLYLLGRSSLNCENRNETIMRGGRKSLKLFLCFIPTFLAAWVAVTRTIDNWHHYADILAGSIIGAVSACVSYSYNYASIFHTRHAGVPLQEYHAACCKDHLNERDVTYTNSESLTDQGNDNGSPTKARNDYVVNVHNRTNGTGVEIIMKDLENRFLSDGLISSLTGLIDNLIAQFDKLCASKHCRDDYARVHSCCRLNEQYVLAIKSSSTTWVEVGGDYQALESYGRLTPKADKNRIERDERLGAHADAFIE
ncbi:phosphatidic acid phosphatase [Plasmopara halstedii]|uniref:Phosphatidic acid phosphatase n=1 Tax=Plasmopara halstedii TaxID=4781 RepID=A0A0P1AW38_PLAHL|nr:phosphatidic acid phosphatase [Plasmopara halstedii]CEG44751.1 phosphatidic acid phosphatase [Plasmopara halstedii]|eukprot:XP_024581120.1 phosphatidic acid phosphatase [Plasmopara halstedii]